MTDITVMRWKRYGHDRAYATDAAGVKIGYLDLVSGNLMPEPGADRQVLDVSTRTWCVDNDVTLPDSPVVDTPSAPATAHATTETSTAVEPSPAAGAGSSPATPVEPPAEAAAWTDLSVHRPGEGVRQLADTEWVAAKGRSKFFSFANRYVFDNHTQERAWRKGAEGEEYGGQKLDKLRERGWHVLHSVPVGKGDSDIDHIAIGPGGVFTVNSKKHDGKKIWVAKYQMRVDGHVVPYLRNSRHEAARAKKLLDTRLDFEVPVMGCVVVLTGSIVPKVTYKQMPDDVRVLDKWDVPRWFKKRPAVLNADQVEAVFDVARRSTTWTS